MSDPGPDFEPTPGPAPATDPIPPAVDPDLPTEPSPAPATDPVPPPTVS